MLKPIAFGLIALSVGVLAVLLTVWTPSAPPNPQADTADQFDRWWTSNYWSFREAAQKAWLAGYEAGRAAGQSQPKPEQSLRWIAERPLNQM